MKITNNLKCYKQCKVLVLNLVLSQTHNGHIPLCDEWVVYGSTHTSWWVNRLVVGYCLNFLMCTCLLLVNGQCID
jgi:hypothetical protein